MSSGPRWAPTVYSPCCGAIAHVCSKRGEIRKRKCTDCGKSFKEYQAKRSRSCGSGKVAEKITHGRGAVWGQRWGGQLV